MTIKTVPEIKNNENAGICVPCGGMCCKTSPGINHPLDFGSKKETIKTEIIRLLRTGFYIIDCWDGESREDTNYYIRPAHINEKGKIFNRGFRGTCSLLNDEGCSITNFNDRPFQCRALIPSKLSKLGGGFGCKSKFDKPYMVKIWKDWKSMMLDILESFDIQYSPPELYPYELFENMLPERFRS